MGEITCNWSMGGQLDYGRGDDVIAAIPGGSGPYFEMLSVAPERVGTYTHRYVVSHNRTDVSNDHTSMTAPLPVCSAKLSMLGPG